MGAVLDDIQQDASFAVQDPSGRSFRLTRQSGHGRQRKELAEKLDAEKVKKGGRVSRETAKLQTLLRACQPEADKEESLFFWIAEPSVSKGKKVQPYSSVHVVLDAQASHSDQYVLQSA